MDFWTLWCKTLGHKVTEDNKQADKAAALRTFWVLLHVTTCFFIIANAIRHWND